MPREKFRHFDAWIWAFIGGGTVLLLSRFPLRRAILLTAGLAFLVGCLLWPPIILPALAFAVPFGPGIPLGGFTLGTTDLLIGLLLGLWILQSWAHRSWKWPHIPLVWPLLLYLITLTLSLAHAWNLHAAIPEFIKWAEILLLYITASALLSANHTVPSIPFSPRDILTVSLILAGVAEALLGLAQFFLRLGPPGFIILGRFLRAYGTFAQPNPYAGYLGLTFPLALSLGLHAFSELFKMRREAHRLSTWTLVGLWFYPISASIMGLGLLASWSRGGWLGMAAGISVVIALRSRRAALLSGILLFLLLAAIVLGSIGAFPPALAQRFQGLQDWSLFLRPVELRAIRVTEANFALVERMAHWWAAYAMWKDHPFLGVGIGNYPIAYEAYRMPGWKAPLGHAHNIVLHVMAETGLIGLAGYLILWAWVFILGFRSLKTRQGRERALLVGALGSLTHLTVHNLFDNLYVHGMYAYVALLLALLTQTSGKPSRAMGKRPNGRTRQVGNSQTNGPFDSTNGLE